MGSLTFARECNLFILCIFLLCRSCGNKQVRKDEDGCGRRLRARKKKKKLGIAATPTAVKTAAHHPYPRIVCIKEKRGLPALNYKLMPSFVRLNGVCVYIYFFL